MRATLTLLLLGSGALLFACKKAPPQAVSMALGDKASATEILRNFELNDVTNGVKTMTLRSIEGRVYEAQHYADVDQPLLIFYKAGKESSRVKAPQGRVQTQTHDVECWGGVTVVSADSTTLTTERMRYDPKRQKIFSNDPVHLEKPDSVTDGMGLETDPDLKKVKMGRQVVRMKQGGRP